MSHHWLLITFTWFGTVSLQYINTGGPGADSILESPESPVHYSLAYNNYFDPPQRDDFEIIQSDEPNNYNDFIKAQDLQRKRRTVNDKEDLRDRRWQPNLIDTDRTTYLQTDNKVISTPFIAEPTIPDENGTDMKVIEEMEKKNFSPWGGKRDKPSIEHMWTWKRASSLREPSMPKRVRFSPWGGKRSGQMVFKPGSKVSKIIFSTSFPELTRIVSNLSPNGQNFNLAGFHFAPSLDKRYPLKGLSLSSQLEDKSLRDALPFKMFMENLPKMYKPGHPYSDVQLKKDGKRKSKFSAWGGKRSPPIIGPIWVPTRQAATESVLNAVLLLRSNQDPEVPEAILNATQ